MSSPSAWNRDEWITHVEHVLVETFTLHAECMKTKLGGARVSEYKHVLHPKLVDALTRPTTDDFNLKTALDAAVRRGRTRGELLEHGLSDGEARVFWWGLKKAALEFVEPPRDVRQGPAGGIVALRDRGG
jgi:hypothetical protein